MINNLLNDSLTMRFNTLERNIKSKSNSFYDSYLDLLEATIKYILDENKITYDDSRTCGYLVKEESIKKFLLTNLKLDDYTYNKLPDYIKKCNDHKHKKEKTLGIDSIINYLKVYFDLVNYYASIYGETERLNNQYKEEVLKLKDELKDLYISNKMSDKNISIYKSIIENKDLELCNIDKQNQILAKQLNELKNIKINSLEDKISNTIESLREFGLAIKNNQIVKEILNQNDIDGIESNMHSSKKRINKAIDGTKKVIDNINDYSKKGKKEINKFNENLQEFINLIKK